MTITLIVATDSRRGIGLNNALPWRLPEDLARFRQTTLGHPLIMGRKTFESIGRPLPQRRNIVISRNPGWRHDGTEHAASLTGALQMAEGAGEVFVIGGAQIYEQAMPLAGRLLATEIEGDFGCDTFFPAMNLLEWQEIARERHHSDQNDVNFAFVTYQRIS